MFEIAEKKHDTCFPMINIWVIRTCPFKDHLGVLKEQCTDGARQGDVSHLDF